MNNNTNLIDKMKKLVLSVAMATLMSGAFAQKSNLSQTKNALYEPADLVKAKNAIEPALTNAETKDLAETHYLAGQVYFKTVQAESNKKLLGETPNQGLQRECVVKAIDEYLVAYDLDQKPNEKGKIKPKYQKEIEKNLKTLSNSLVEIGYDAYSSKDYKSTVAIWGKYIDLPKSNPQMFGEIAKDSLYDDMRFYAINAAMLDESLTDKGIELMEEFKTSGHKDAETAAQWLYKTYADNKKDDTKAVRTLKECAKIFPNSNFFTANLINYYIKNNQANEAIKYLDEAIAQNPKDPQYYVVKGNTLVDLKKYDDAIKAYNDVINGVEPNNAAAHQGIGLVYISKATEIQSEAEALPLNQKAKYNAKKAEAKEMFKKAIDPLEKSRKINPNDLGTLNLLQSVYMTLNMGKEAQEVKKAMDNVK